MARHKRRGNPNRKRKRTSLRSDQRKYRRSQRRMLEYRRSQEQGMSRLFICLSGSITCWCGGFHCAGGFSWEHTVTTYNRTVQSNRDPYPIVLIERQVEKEVITVDTPSPTSPSPVPSIISDPPSTPIIISDSPPTTCTHSHQEDEYAPARRMVEEYMARHRERMAKKRKKRKNPLL